jgi:hypothetical protein
MNKIILLLAACLAVSGCGREAENQRELRTELDALKEEVTAKQVNAQPNSVRWAFVNRREIETAISQYSFSKMNTATNDYLSPEMAAKLADYDRLQGQLARARMVQMRPKNFPAPQIPDFPLTTNYEELAQEVEKARGPVADIIERRNRRLAQYRDEFTPDKLVAEYVKGRYDLVVDSSDQMFGRSAVVYRGAGDAPDITDGVLKLLKEKSKL